MGRMLAHSARICGLPVARPVLLRGRTRLCRAAPDVVKEGREVDCTNNLVPFEEDLILLRRLSDEKGFEDIQQEAEVQETPNLLQKIGDSVAKLANGSDRTSCLVLLNVMTFIMATNWVVVKDAETMLDPFTFSALRFLLAALAFVPWLNRTQPIDKDVVKAGVELGFWCAMGYITQSLGLLTTDASRASFLSAFTVILVPIISGLSGKGVSKTTWSAAFVAMLGTSMLEQGGGAVPGVGDAFSLLSAAFFAIQIIRTEHYSKSLKNQTTGLLATSLATTAVVSSILAVGVHPAECLQMIQNFHSTDIPWKEIVYTGVFSTDLVLFIELVALNNVSSTDAAIIYTMEPVLGALMAYCFLGERWGPLGWFGAALILTSSLATQLWGGDKTLGTAEEQ